MAITMDGIFVNGQKVTFHPEDILSGDASAYTEEIGAAVEEWLEENVTGGEQVTDTTLTLPGVPADAEVTGDKIEAVKRDLNAIQSATSEDVSKALKAKTVADGKVTEWEFGEAGNTTIIADNYSSTVTYAVGDYCVYENALYKCNTAIETAEAWYAEHWTAVTVGGELTDANVRLDMCVVKQLKPKPEPVENVQCVNPDNILSKSTASRMYVSRIDVDKDGTYYANPKATTVAIYNIHAFNVYNEELTFTDRQGNTGTSISSIQLGSAAWFTIENKRVIKTYVRSGQLAQTYTFDSDISYFSHLSDSMYILTSNSNYELGLTYGEAFDDYVPYGDTPETPSEYEYGYNVEVAKYVEAYMQVHGTAATNNMLNFIYPENDNSEFVNAVKYYHERAERQRSNVVRIASFNKFVSRGRNNWSTIKQELADYSVDICGFQECGAIVEDEEVTDQIGAYLQGWQFKGYAPQDTVIDKAIVSRWAVTHTDLITLLTYDDNAGTSNAIHALMTIPTDKWYSNVVNADATLSVYSYHGTSSGKTIGGASYTGYQIRQMEINALLAIIANDTADFIVIVGDTNAFQTGFDTTTGTHAEWEMFRNAGFTPVLDGHDSTVTADTEDKFFFKIGDEVHCLCAYDQIFIGTNITVKRFGVVDSNLYPIPSGDNVPVSDHCMVYADLEFDFDAVQQAKLAEIAVTTPWW